MSNPSSLVLLHLSLIKDTGPGLIERIVKAVDYENLESLYDLSAHQLHMGTGIMVETAQKIVDGLRDKSALEKELNLIDQHAISWASYCDKQYPEILKNIHLPPPILYWKGTLARHENSLAVVGSRDANAYGNAVINELVPALVAHDWIIVSGGARGADTMAHRATLDHNGITLAVLGSGLLIPYPPENKPLFDEIIQEGGAVISSFPVTMEPLPGNFPARNRIIAGLSRGCLVIQAAAKSGTRITAEFCLTQSREVFAIPGPIDDPLSKGCHKLIQSGAKLVTGIDDILIEFGQEVVSQTTFIPASVSSDPLTAAIITVCSRPCTTDELLEQTGVPLIELTSLLFDLQIKGLINQNIAGLWEKR